MWYYDDRLVHDVAHKALYALEAAWQSHRGTMPEDQEVGHVCAAMALACVIMFTKAGFDRKLFVEQLTAVFDSYQKLKGKIGQN